MLKKPFSDEALAEIISDRGVKLARRTVAKYRELMKIPSSSERRRRAKVFGD
jgi:RNA polymerase sigma-54 factor